MGTYFTVPEWVCVHIRNEKDSEKHARTQRQNYNSVIKRRLAKGKAAMTGMSKIWKDQNIRIETKVRLVKALVFSVTTYGAETWVMRKQERKKVDAFEMWCWRRLLRVSWTERKTNKWILEQVKSDIPLEAKISQSLLQYVGHVIRNDGSLEKDILFGQVAGKRRRGRPRLSFWDRVKDVSGRGTQEIVVGARHREGWRRAIRDITRSRTRLDGTR